MAAYVLGAWSRHHDWEQARARDEAAAGGALAPAGVSGQPWFDAWAAAVSGLAIACVRVQDSQIRELVGRFSAVGQRLGTLETPREVGAAFGELRRTATEINERAGAIYQQFDAPEAGADQGPLCRWLC